MSSKRRTMVMKMINPENGIRPEHERKAHVNAYAEEIQFKLGFMVFIWGLVLIKSLLS